MRRLRFIIIAAVLSSLLSVNVRSEEGEIFVVSYIELLPGVIDGGVALLNRYAAVSREESGNLKFLLLHEIGRTNRFAILEIWKSKTDIESHNTSADTKQFQQTFKMNQGAPIDTRIEQTFCTGRALDDRDTGGVFVLTHLDIAPEHDKDGTALIRDMCSNSVKEPGNLAYEATRQSNRLNHFTLIEHWESVKALDSHSAAPHTLKFRQAVLPMEGALYDERRYEAVP
jgi:quinol monooxygenase YgiN